MEHVPLADGGNLEELDAEPGATVMWFGKFKGERLDELADDYRWYMVHLSRKSHSADMVAYRDVHDIYLEWLDERISPMSTIIWFGKYEGHDLRVLYYPRRWKWLLKNCDKWRHILRDIERMYIIWKQKRPHKSYHSRAPAAIVNPVGEKLGLGDDRLASDNDESYATDDGFVVPDEEDEDEEDEDEGNEMDILEDEEDEEDEEADLDDLDDAGSEQDDTGVLEELPRTEEPGTSENLTNWDDDESSAVSLPSLDEIVRSSAVKQTPTPSRRLTRSNGKLASSYITHTYSESDSGSDKSQSPKGGRKRRRMSTRATTPCPEPRATRQPPNEDSDVVVPVSQRSFKTGRRKRRAPLVAQSDSEDSLDRGADCIIVGERRDGRHADVDGPRQNTRSHKRADQADFDIQSSASRLDTGNALDSDDEPFIPKLRAASRLDTGDAPDSDDEPLIPKLRAARQSATLSPHKSPYNTRLSKQR